MKKHLLAFFLVILVLVTSVFAASGKDETFKDWQTKDWRQSEEDGTQILKGTGDNNLLYLAGQTNSDSLQFDFRIDERIASIDGNVGCGFKSPSGCQYFFEYNTVSAQLMIRRLGDDGTARMIGRNIPIRLEVGEWYNFKLNCNEEVIEFYIDDQLKISGKGIKNDIFGEGTYYIQCYNNKISLKNIVLNKGVIAQKEYKKYPLDFEFSSSKSIDGFVAENGNVSYSDGKLVFRLGGKDATLETPYIHHDPGEKYSAKISMRNTVFVRMANKTSATQMKLYYFTTDSTEYDERKSVTIDVEPNSDFKSYYFNLSAAQISAGYLRGFKLVPVDASSGEVIIDAITFEREAKLGEYVGEIVSCTTDGTTITVKGKVSEEFKDQKVTIYETGPSNYLNDTTGRKILGSAKANGTDFTVEFKVNVGKATRVTAMYIAKVKSKMIGDKFTVDMSSLQENPYAFTIPEKSVKVTEAPYNAKGDAFTNDTKAIQKAIDDMNAAGGGVVIVPGDNSFYGKRYIATSIVLKDNVELRIEKGAVIWQSPRKEDYDYDVKYGHDIPIAGVNWTHTASVHNYPLIYAANANNIKLTGEGLLRCVDTGSENIDSVSGSIWTGCENRIHIVPIGFWRCENVEINGVGIRRNNNYHINLRTCKNIYVANVSMLEVTCASGDGISATVGTKNVKIDHCFFYSNDDAVTICSTYNDPRGLAWWKAQPEGDNCVENIYITNSNLYGGHGVTFITWGTDNPDLSKQEIRNITVTNNVLGGGTNAVGAWPDNPYFGKQPYDGSEGKDFSPVKNVRIYGNIYEKPTTLDTIQATNVITDCGITSATQFQNGKFEHSNRSYARKGYVTGLTNWDSELGEKGNVTFEGDNDNHYADIKGNASLYQGLYFEKGTHKITIDTYLTGGTAKIFAKDAESGQLIAEKEITSSESFEEQTLEIVISKNRTLFVGISHEGSENDSVQIDNASTKKTSTKTANAMDRETKPAETESEQSSESVTETEKATETESLAATEAPDTLESETTDKNSDSESESSVAVVIAVVVAVAAVIAAGAAVLLKKSKK